MIEMLTTSLKPQIWWCHLVVMQIVAKRSAEMRASRATRATIIFLLLANDIIYSVFTWRHGGHVGVPKQWNGGHVGCTELILRELSSIIYMFRWKNKVTDHVSENTLYENGFGAFSSPSPILKFPKEQDFRLRSEAERFVRLFTMSRPVLWRYRFENLLASFFFLFFFFLNLASAHFSAMGWRNTRQTCAINPSNLQEVTPPSFAY